MSSIDVPLKDGGFGQTARKDNWWVEPLLVFLGYCRFHRLRDLGRCSATTSRTTQCPAPAICRRCTRRCCITSAPAWWPAFLPFSAAMLILWAPAGFRFTCYYYRGAYYKAFWADPLSCAVGEPRKTYRGEKKFPLILQNVHRYFLYFAIIFVFILAV